MSRWWGVGCCQYRVVALLNTYTTCSKARYIASCVIFVTILGGVVASQSGDNRILICQRLDLSVNLKLHFHHLLSISIIYKHVHSSPTYVCAATSVVCCTAGTALFNSFV
jgi:hypothetical protein